jgi:uncharacterized protein YjiS (DUF1127 family)
LHEGIDNHFTMIVPGRKDQYLISPFGMHWSEARASDMMIFNPCSTNILTVLVLLFHLRMYMQSCWSLNRLSNHGGGGVLSKPVHQNMYP